jgi:hypothetical protein
VCLFSKSSRGGWKVQSKAIRLTAMFSLLFLSTPGPVARCQEEQAEWKSSVPFTYLIEYGPGHVDNPDYLKKIGAAPPTLMHVGEDVVFSSVLGIKDVGVYSGPRSKAITTEQARAKFAELQQYTAAMHRAGVRWIIPYINNYCILGDSVAHTGFWEFYDHWDRYQEFGFGPRPTVDLLTAQIYGGPPAPRPPRGRELGPHDGFYPYKRYELCVNNPTWRNILLNITRIIAQTGMDGVFCDEMTFRDYCTYDQAKFREYLRHKYSPAERQRLFGTSALDSLRMGYRGEGALWHESQAFWSWSLGELLRGIRDAGRQVNPDFFVVPNLGTFASVDGAFKRVSGGKDSREWAPYCRVIMFEENQRPGQFAPGVFLDEILQYKLAFGMAYVGGMLIYNAQDAAGIELSMAEAGAGGGGTFIQANYAEPESRKKYRHFFETNADLFAGYDSQADVALVYAYDQAYWGNPVHLATLYSLRQYLSDHHILFDIIPPSKVKGGRLNGRYKAVITSGLWYLSDDVIAALRNFAHQGGVWVDIGGSGRFDDAGRLRAGILEAPRAEPVGKGIILRRGRLEDVMHLPGFERYWVTEDEDNNLADMVKHYRSSLLTPFPFPPPTGGEDLQTLLETFTGTSLSVVPAARLEGLRCNVWRKAGGAHREIVTAHLVNYYSPIPNTPAAGGEHSASDGPQTKYAPRVLDNVAVRLRLHPGRVTSLLVYDPDDPRPVPVKFQQSGSDLEFALPPIRIYKIAEITLETSH